MRKPEKVSSSLNHRWFYSYGKPLKFLSRGLSEKTHKGFISKPFKLSVYRAQRVDEKNGVIRLVMLTLRVMVIRMSKMVHFMYFLMNTAKHQSQSGQDV